MSPRRPLLSPWSTHSTTFSPFNVRILQEMRIFQVNFCITLLGLPQPRTADWGMNNRNASSHSFGGWKFRVKVLVGLVPSEGSRGRSAPHLSPWHEDGHLLSVSSHGIFPLWINFLVPKFPVPKFPPFKGPQSEWIRDHSDELTLTWLPLLRPYLHIRLHLKVLSVGIQNANLGGTQFNL